MYKIVGVFKGKLVEGSKNELVEKTRETDKSSPLYTLGKLFDKLIYARQVNRY